MLGASFTIASYTAMEKSGCGKTANNNKFILVYTSSDAVLDVPFHTKEAVFLKKSAGNPKIQCHGCH